MNTKIILILIIIVVVSTEVAAIPQCQQQPSATIKAFGSYEHPDDGSVIPFDAAGETLTTVGGYNVFTVHKLSLEFAAETKDCCNLAKSITEVTSTFWIPEHCPSLNGAGVGTVEFTPTFSRCDMQIPPHCQYYFTVHSGAISKEGFLLKRTLRNAGDRFSDVIAVPPP